MIFHRVTKKTFALGTIDFFYWVAGDDQNPPLLLIPGFSGTHSNLLELSSRLRENYFVIIPDLPGWGMSPRLKTNLTIPHYADFLYELVKSAGYKRIYLLGHCMGATLAIEFSHKYQNIVNELFLVSPPYEKDVVGAQWLVHLIDMGRHEPSFFHPVFYFWRNRYLSFLLGLFILKFRSFSKTWKISRKNINSQKQEDDRIVEENWLSLVHYNYEKLKEIDIPVHMIFGSQDLLISRHQAEKLHQLLPASTLDFIPHAGHLPPVESPDTLASIIIKYLDG